MPPIPVSEATLNDLMGLSSTVLLALLDSAGESDRSNIQGNGSDPGLHPGVNELLAQGNLAAAVEFARTLEDASQRNENLFAVSRAFSIQNRTDEAREVALTLTETPPEKPYAAFSGARSIRDQALFYVAQGYWNEGQLETALELVGLMNEEAQLSPLLRIAEKYWDQGQQAAASATLERATAVYKNLATRSEAEYVLQFWALARLVGVYIRFDQEEGRSQAADLTSELFELAQTFPTQEYGTLSLLTGAVITYVRAGQTESATTALSYILNNVDVVTEPYLKAMIVAGAANQYAALAEGTSSGDAFHERAADLMAQAEDLANTEDDSAQRNVIAAAFSLVYYEMGQADNALRVTNVVEPPALRDQIQQALACANSSQQRQN
ncbi:MULTISPECIES: hypothetical protein [unclassified Leptolyngbya]|uniref:hypothetical protein n=1 Tax=unclassified Leptolyngbya TaxID=2650499 RepID=UPI001683ED32|nr:hypothetical protein [Leptolyngbya sp. FACHB-8]MBD2158252.1 hypothetical protein [Leptolyngbya sp. FACHB-16]